MLLARVISGVTVLIETTLLIGSAPPQASPFSRTVKSKDGPWDLSKGTDPWVIAVTNEKGLVVTHTLTTAAIPPRPAILSFVPAVLYEKLEKGVVTGKETVALTLEIDGQAFPFAFDPVVLSQASGIPSLSESVGRVPPSIVP